MQNTATDRKQNEAGGTEQPAAGVAARAKQPLAAGQPIGVRHPIAAGVIGGGLTAVVAVLISLALPSPDPVFLNPLSVGFCVLVLGLVAGVAWRLLGRGRLRFAFGTVWALGLLAVGLAAIGLESVLSGLVRYVLPLAAMGFALTGVLTAGLTPRLNNTLRWAVPVAIVVPMGLGAALAERAAPAAPALDLPVATSVSVAAPPEQVARPTAAAPVVTPAAALAAAAAPVVTAAAPVATVAATKAPARVPGHYTGVNFVVGSGSKVTFTVKEQLARMPLPNSAVVTSSALSGEVHLDGRPSTVQLDLQRLTSDQPNRDKYIRSTLFPQDRVASITLDDVPAVPDGSSTDALQGTVAGTLTLKGGTYPLTFDWQGRDDGAVLNLIGHTTFGWKDVGLDTPNSQSVVSVDDTVTLDVVLAARPK